MCCRSVVKAGGSVQLALAMMRSKQAKKKRALANTLARTLPSIPFLQTDGDQVASAVVAVAGGSLREEGRQQGSNELRFCDLLSGFMGRRVLFYIEYLSFFLCLFTVASAWLTRLCNFTFRKSAGWI